jgi:regulator of cell morphogenesis and NO signaling
MTNDPIQRLLDEHVELMSRFEPLRRGVRLLAERGEAAVPEVLPVMADVSRIMQSDLLAHARREDNALFPAVEAALGEQYGPTVVMRQEHRDIHANAELFRDTLRELNQVQHPAIEAGSARLGQLAATGASAEVLRATGAELLRLIDDHFAKEQEILFPVAREILDRSTLRDVARRMDELDAV